MRPWQIRRAADFPKRSAGVATDASHLPNRRARVLSSPRGRTCQACPACPTLSAFSGASDASSQVRAPAGLVLDPAACPPCEGPPSCPRTSAMGTVPPFIHCDLPLHQPSALWRASPRETGNLGAGGGVLTLGPSPSRLPAQP